MSHYESQQCYYCGQERNPLSQACGTCMRDATMYSIGMKKNIPDYIREKLKYRVITTEKTETKEKK